MIANLQKNRDLLNHNSKFDTHSLLWGIPHPLVVFLIKMSSFLYGQIQ
jgi:hypothetical protein